MKAIISAMLAGLLVAGGSCQKEISSTSSSGSSGSGSSSTTYYYQSGGTVSHSSKTWYSTINDTSAVYVTGSGKYTISQSRIWSSGNTSNTDNSSFYGLNAGVLAYNGTITLSNDSIRTTGSGANGVFAYGSGVATLSEDTIVCTGNLAHAIMASGGGTLTATDVIATTSGNSSSIIATDRGGGTITVVRGNYTTYGGNSAAVYSTGTIQVTDAKLTTHGAEAFVIEGSNSATLTNCTTVCDYDKWGALVYQSFSGDASGSVGQLTLTGGSFTYTGTKGGLFYNTNDTARIYLNGVTISNSCDTLLRSIKGGWNSVSATNGGNAYLICSGQTLAGLIYADNNSKAELRLSNNSRFTGKVNPDNVAVKAAVVLDAGSTWTLTGDSYLTAFSNASSSNANITAGSYHLYVNGVKIL